jgi:hypothetical protein
MSFSTYQHSPDLQRLCSAPIWRSSFSALGGGVPLLDKEPKAREIRSPAQGHAAAGSRACHWVQDISAQSGLGNLGRFDP